MELVDIPQKAEYGYQPSALGRQVFIKPVSTEHPSHLIIPPAYEPASSIGFVHCFGPEVTGLKQGDLVLYDRFATTGNEFDLLDEGGECVKMVRLDSNFVFATLTRVKL